MLQHGIENEVIHADAWTKLKATKQPACKAERSSIGIGARFPRPAKNSEARREAERRDIRNCCPESRLAQLMRN